MITLEWLTFLEDEKGKLLLEAIAKQYLLTKEEYLNVIDMSIYNHIITGECLSLENLTFICEEIYKRRDLIQKHVNHEFATACLKHSFEKARQTDPSFEHLRAFLETGYVFHSFSPAFLPSIQSKGLVLKEKPWDLNEIEEVRKIFQKHKMNIFGFYQGRSSTPVFFTDHLLSSPYYGLSSPTFFRKFIEHNPSYFDVFLNRDYNRAKEGMEELCTPLTAEEKNIVWAFFQKSWDFFATDTLPCLAISTKEQLGIPHVPASKDEQESLEHYYLRQLINAQNYAITHDIKREDLSIFQYDTLSFTSYQKQKNI